MGTIVDTSKEVAFTLTGGTLRFTRLCVRRQKSPGRHQSKQVVTMRMPFMHYMNCKSAWQIYRNIPVVALGMVVGTWAEKRSDLRMSKFHNKSALFGGQKLAPGERCW